MVLFAGELMPRTFQLITFKSVDIRGDCGLGIAVDVLLLLLYKIFPNRRIKVVRINTKRLIPKHLRTLHTKGKGTSIRDNWM